MDIGRKDVIWNYAATFLKIGVGVILLPFILRTFPQETVAIWSIFTIVITLTGLFDFGFNSSFARNVTYVVSGVKTLKTTGYQIVDDGDSEIDYSLFKGLIEAMRWFYSRMAIALFLLLSTVGTYYIYIILKSYSGDHKEVYISWVILCIINSYSLYTLYYESLMQGKGLIKRSKQIDVIGYTAYLTIAIALILLHFNLIAIVSAQVLMVLIKRFLSYKVIYTTKFKYLLNNVKAQAQNKILKSIYPNAIKNGLTILGNFLVVRSAMIIGPLYLSLNTMASYGISGQIILLISNVSIVYFLTYQPKLSQYRIQNETNKIISSYLKSCLFMFCTFISAGMILFFLGDWALRQIGSQTCLLPKSYIVVMLLFSLLNANHSIAGSTIMTKNEVPFFSALMFSGGLTIVLLVLLLGYTNLDIWCIILAPCIANLYNNWKWPYEVYTQLHISTRDILNTKK
jgi:O-antigen/teichoic acid export membrane protein